jgi:hypothetical protein
VLSFLSKLNVAIDFVCCVGREKGNVPVIGNRWYACFAQSLDDFLIVFFSIIRKQIAFELAMQTEGACFI